MISDFAYSFFRDDEEMESAEELEPAYDADDNASVTE